MIYNKELTAVTFAFYWHDEQKRKYTGEPYVTHCIAVADIIKSITEDTDIIFAAYFHDILEDTKCPEEEIGKIFGERVLDLVKQVTDISKPANGNRMTRKQIDLEHLAKADAEAQTIKLADLIHNTQSIVKGDKDFAKCYLREKEKLLEVLVKGDIGLHKRACGVLIQGKLELMDNK